MVSAALREIFNAEDAAHARERAGAVITRLTDPCPKVAELLEGAEEDLLAFYAFPAAHWTKLRSTNPLERVNREICTPRGRRRDLPQRAPPRSVSRAALLIEQNDEWLVARRYLRSPSRSSPARQTAEIGEREEVLGELPAAAWSGGFQQHGSRARARVNRKAVENPWGFQQLYYYNQRVTPQHTT